MAESNSHSPNQLPDEPELRRQERRTEGRAPEEPQAAALSRRGIAGDRCGDLQRHRQEDARSEGQQSASAAAAHAPGQHGQQRAGPQKPGRRSTTEGSATSCESVAVARRLAQLGRRRSKPQPTPYGPPGQPAPCVPGQPAAQQGEYTQPQLSPAHRRSSSSPPKTVNSRMTLASPRISSMRASPTLRHSNNRQPPQV